MVSNGTPWVTMLSFGIKSQVHNMAAAQKREGVDVHGGSEHSKKSYFQLVHSFKILNGGRRARAGPRNYVLFLQSGQVEAVHCHSGLLRLKPPPS